jgi:MoaA/NifB/PqqE/SkfB family radical SAM enzyme
MITGGEPLLHSNLWSLGERLQEHGIRVTLVTTGLLARATRRRNRPASSMTSWCRLTGRRTCTTRYGEVRGGYDRIARGLAALRDESRRPRVIAARSSSAPTSGCLATPSRPCGRCPWTACRFSPPM